MAITEEHRAMARRATARARKELQPGDRLYITRCGGGRGTVTMVGWSGDWICSKSKDDIHALHVLKVNGMHRRFTDIIGMGVSGQPIYDGDI